PPSHPLPAQTNRESLIIARNGESSTHLVTIRRDNSILSASANMHSITVKR
ncbi:unnamed protein product, partial [Musa hybrid cultivar]